MATNLRLRPDAEQALRARAALTGRSQQELIREAVDRYLGHDAVAPLEGAAEGMISSGVALAPRTPYREADQLLGLPGEKTTEALLGRDEQR